MNQPNGPNGWGRHWLATRKRKGIFLGTAEGRDSNLGSGDGIPCQSGGFWYFTWGITNETLCVPVYESGASGFSFASDHLLRPV